MQLKTTVFVFIALLLLGSVSAIVEQVTDNGDGTSDFCLVNVSNTKAIAGANNISIRLSDQYTVYLCNEANTTPETCATNTTTRRVLFMWNLVVPYLKGEWQAAANQDTQGRSQIKNDTYFDVEAEVTAPIRTRFVFIQGNLSCLCSS